MKRTYPCERLARKGSFEADLRRKRRTATDTAAQVRAGRPRRKLEGTAAIGFVVPAVILQRVSAMATTLIGRTFAGSLTHNLEQEVLLRGWVHRLRVLARTTFVILRDCSGQVQCVAPS